MTFYQPWLHNFTPLANPLSVYLGDNSTQHAIGYGDINITLPGGQIMTISKVYLVPKLTKNLLSVSELTANGASIEFHHLHCIIKVKLTTGESLEIHCPQQAKDGDNGGGFADDDTMSKRDKFDGCANIAKKISTCQSYSSNQHLATHSKVPTSVGLPSYLSEALKRVNYSSIAAAKAMATQNQGTGNIVVYVIVRDKLHAGKVLASININARLVACVNQVPRVESTYLWQGKGETDSEDTGLKLVDDSHHGDSDYIEQQCWDATEDGIVAGRCQAAKHTSDEAGGSERALEELVPVILVLCKDGMHLGSIRGNARHKLQLCCEQGGGVLLALARGCIFKIGTGCSGNLNMALVMASIPIGKLVCTRACGGCRLAARGAIRMALRLDEKSRVKPIRAVELEGTWQIKRFVAGAQADGEGVLQLQEMVEAKLRAMQQKLYAANFLTAEMAIVPQTAA
ncbi:hypothetical protein L7F22_033991 [Adiantum nelumboides]|nr:hypothetical protein [Adiantum nelumboides]